MKTVLIIGGTGFVGKSFLDCFVQNKLNKFKIKKLILLARNIKKIKIKFKNYKKKNLIFIKGDICKLKQIPKADYIFHAAASTDEKKYLHQSKKQITNNIDSVKNFLNIIKNKNFIYSRIVFLSSGAVYGLLKNIKDSKEKTKINFLKIKKFSESKKNYAFSKIICEKMINNHVKKFKTNIKIARLFAFIGKNIPLNKYFLIGNVINGILKKRTIVIKSPDPKNTFRSFMYADDMVFLLIKIAMHKKISHNIFNVGSDEIFSVCDLENLIFKNYKINFFYKKHSYNLKDLYVPDLDKIYSIFKNIKLTRLEQSLKKNLN